MRTASRPEWADGVTARPDPRVARPCVGEFRYDAPMFRALGPGARLTAALVGLSALVTAVPALLFLCDAAMLGLGLVIVQRTAAEVAP